MKKALYILLICFCIQILSADFKTEALQQAKNYEALITRDIWGVTHIDGKRDADVGLGRA